MIVTQFYQPADALLRRPVPLIVSRVSAGFPSPADGYLDGKLDLNEHLITNKSATYMIRAVGDSMCDAGMLDGDLLIVDRSLQPCNGDIVIASVGGEFLVKRLRVLESGILLEAANDRYLAIHISDNTDFEVWGVVTNAIHTYRK